MTFDQRKRCFFFRYHRRILQSFCFGIIVLFLFIWVTVQTKYLIPEATVPFQFIWEHNMTRNVSIYLTPEKSTTLLEPKEPCLEEIDYLFVIPSSINNTRQRQIIRRTWGSWIISAKGKTNSRMKLLFMLGINSSQHESISDAIIEEAKEHEDIIIENFVDSYLNLTLKSVFILKWTKLTCPNIKYLVKVDDDVFVYVPKLIKSINSMNLTKNCIIGSLICNAKPIHNRQSKWFSPKYMYTVKMYPNYLSGTAYIVAGSLINELYHTALHTPYFHLEDIFLTGICAKKIGIRPINHPGFSLYQSAEDPCLSVDFVTRHEPTTAGVIKLWNLVHNSSLINKCLAKNKLKRNVTPKLKRSKKVYKPPPCRW